MNNYETTNIIHLLPRELQIHCLQFLITPNERILVVGSKKVGKTSFINRFINNDNNQDNTRSICTINNRAKIVEVTKDNYNFKQKPTKILIICDITSSYSITQIYNKFIPKYKNLNVPFTIIINRKDLKISKWEINLLHEICRKMNYTNIPIHSIYMNGHFPIQDFEYITNEI
jgi:GTPase SAR1 family protein